MKESIDSSSFLAIKIDRMQTKIFFFDIVDETYHLIASSESSTSVDAPFHDVREGISRAVDRIQKITGRRFYDEESNFILPTQADGNGVDHLVITYGFYSEIKVISMGLLESVSLESLTKLLEMTQLNHFDQIGMNDSRKLEEIIALFTNNFPEMVVIAGGVNDGAARSIMRQLELLLFCIKLLPKEKRPYLIFSGNSDFEAQMREVIGDLMPFQITQNLRPTINQENLLPAYDLISTINAELLGHKIGGFSHLIKNSLNSPMPISNSSQIMAKFLSLLNKNKEKNVLYLDFGKEVISFSAGSAGISKFLYKNYSFNNNFQVFLKDLNINDVIKRSYEPVNEDEVKSYLWNKTIHPNAVPTTDMHLSIDRAITAIMINSIYGEMQQKWQDFSFDINQVIVSGEIFSQFFSYGDTLLTLLDSLSPSSISTFYIDMHEILPVLGAISKINRYLPVQLMETSAIALLAKVIPFKSNVKIGTELANVILEFEDGNRIESIIEQGMIYQLPVPTGTFVNMIVEQKVKLESDTILKNYEKGFTLQGGLCGLIIDARGRPVLIPKDSLKRKEIQKVWRIQLNH